MALFMRARAAALASLIALSSVVNSQGFYYQDPSLQCGPQYNFQYLGCAATTAAPFPFAPSLWQPGPSADLSRSSINYDNGDFVNMTGTPYFCAQFCRTNGFKYTALWDKQCHCGNSLSYNNLQGTTVTLSVNANSDAQCLNGTNGNPYPPCGGDRRENCGSNGGARIFVDPSFPDERTLPPLATLAQGYGPLGCFKHARFPSGDDTITTVSVQSTETCFEYCADLGMPYLYMEVTPTDIRCNCGTEFNRGSAQATIDTNLCTIKCSNSTDTASCQGHDCCSTGNGPFPVYANPNLMGCFTPIIPGSENPDTEFPLPNGYNCFPTPASISARASSTVVSYGTRTMSASASFIATASPAANAFVNYGCYQNTRVANLFAIVSPYTGTDTQLNVDKCVAFCDGGNHNFAAVWGTPLTQCACGDVILTGVTADGAMEDCNQPCTGSALQNCGGDNGPIVYAKSNVIANPWAVQYSLSYSSTITYTCTPTVGTTTTTTTTSPSTTTTTTSPSTTSTTTTTTTSPSTTTTTTSASTTTTSATTTTSGSTTSSTTTPASSTTTPASSTTTPASSTTTSSGSTTTSSSSTTTSFISTTSPSSSSGSSTTGGSTTGSSSGSSATSGSTTSGSSTSSSSDSSTTSGSTTGSSTTGGSSTGSSSGSSTTGGSTTGSSSGSSATSGSTTSGSSTSSSSGSSTTGGSTTGGSFTSSSSGSSTTGGSSTGSSSGSTTGSSTSGSSGSTSGGTTTPTSGASTDFPHVPWIFEEGYAPDNVPCYETTMSWVPGEPTFLPPRDEL